MKSDEQRTRKSFLIYAAIITALCILFLFLKRDNIVRWVETRHALNHQEETIQSLKDEGERLDRRIENLSGNRDSLEKFARETYQFCADSEDVYIVR